MRLLHGLSTFGNMTTFKQNQHFNSTFHLNTATDYCSKGSQTITRAKKMPKELKTIHWFIITIGKHNFRHHHTLQTLSLQILKASVSQNAIYTTWLVIILPLRHTGSGRWHGLTVSTKSCPVQLKVLWKNVQGK